MAGMYLGIDSTAENLTCPTTYTRGHRPNVIAGLDLSTKLLYTKLYATVKEKPYMFLYSFAFPILLWWAILTIDIVKIMIIRGLSVIYH